MFLPVCLKGLVGVCTHTRMCVCVCVYIYIYIERERISFKPDPLFNVGVTSLTNQVLITSVRACKQTKH
jgi:hypothetical protein